MDDNKGCFAWFVVIPLAVVGAVFLIGKGGLGSFFGKVFLWGVGITVFGIAAIVGLVLFLVFRGAKDKKKGENPPAPVPVAGTSTSARKGQATAQAAQAPPPVDNTNPEQRAVLKKGEENLEKLRRMAAQVKDAQIRTAAVQACDQAEKILRTLREQPDSIPAVRQFLNYYLPATGEILMKYQWMEQSQAVGPEMTGKVFHYLQDIHEALEKQYQNLFEDDLLDLTVEMEAMTMACKRDGLLTDREMMVESDGSPINLTL